MPSFLRTITLGAGVGAALWGMQPVAAAAEDIQLVMFEEKGCVWCEKWRAEIGPIYPKTSEGKIAPLERVDIADGPMEDYTLDRGIFYTPTFVLASDKQELARIEGYPGEDFFWSLLGVMISNLPEHVDSAADATGGDDAVSPDEGGS